MKQNDAEQLVKLRFVPLLDAFVMAKIATISPFKMSKLLNKFSNKVKNL